MARVGATFGAGCVGYETDAAELMQDGPVMRATCRDGTPPTFVVLAWADLSNWRAYGQGGLATMGVYRSGGTVFTAGTVQWADKLDGTSPVIDRITRNVVARLSLTNPGDAWERIGHANAVASMVVRGSLIRRDARQSVVVARPRRTKPELDEDRRG
jgi:hypothetical protein